LAPIEAAKYHQRPV